MKLAVFASGSGTNFENLVKKGIPVEFLFTDKRGAKALERAEKLGVSAYCFELKEFESKVDYETAILTLLAKHEIDLIVLAGYMKIVSPTLLNVYSGRIINIHPAYLPEFPGAHGIADAWHARVSESGVTVHYVDNGIDTGEIIAQRRVPILPNDTLESFESRIHDMEYVLYPEVLKRMMLKK
ncbi:phosphoribosylglycinamide formyltransferase [Lactococcus hodotermopsidis]|uniref:Phosphoribosylglycinamide formyltransferase n=1 Tax=Pseudolactococcus hodotermopsidis TaxID=2709157 RepID=A0A6A0BAV2_9LACT|nr:phosphoribosylglycinamide formyltransferase [Lactococcus hodotermopsidis]GFH41783.1 phosphoribosylglycinamide formyltransferase [Lactococcus hodotermopsidis]